MSGTSTRKVGNLLVRSWGDLVVAYSLRSGDTVLLDEAASSVVAALGMGYRDDSLCEAVAARLELPVDEARALLDRTLTELADRGILTPSDLLADR